MKSVWAAPTLRKVWCQSRYSSTLARCVTLDGYQWSGSLYFWQRYLMMAPLEHSGEREGESSVHQVKKCQVHFLEHGYWCITSVFASLMSSSPAHLSERQKPLSSIAGTFFTGLTFMNSSLVRFSTRAHHTKREKIDGADSNL